MRKAFEKAIHLSTEDNYKESTAFYMDWAERERKILNIPREIEIYHTVLEKYPFPKFNSRSARFLLAIHYFEKGEQEKALAPISIDGYGLFKVEDFWIWFKRFFTSLIRNGRSDKATIVQKIIVKIIGEIQRKDASLAKDILENVNRVITNNTKLKRELIKSCFKTDLDLARQMILDWEETGKFPVSIAITYMDYYIHMNSFENALKHGLYFIESNPTANLGAIYNKLGVIYSMFTYRDWETSISYFEKNDPQILSKNSSYAIALYFIDKDDSKARALNILRNYFSENSESTNKRAISNYIKFCFWEKQPKQASSFLFNKIKQINADIYDDSFISFLFQQQLKWTKNMEVSELLFDKAISYADSDKQKAIVLSNYGKHIMGTSDLNTYKAIELFEASILLKPDPYVELDVARCYFNLQQYDDCLSILSKIDDSEVTSHVQNMQILVHAKTENYNKIVELLPLLTDQKPLCQANYYLAQDTSQSNQQRIAFYRSAVNNAKYYATAVEFAIFLHSIGNTTESTDLITSLVERYTNPKDSINITSRYQNGISIYNSKPNNEQLEEIRLKVSKLKSNNAFVLNKIDQLVDKHPLDVEILSIKFNYHFNTSHYPGCEYILGVLIKNNLVTKESLALFYKLARKYFYIANTSLIKDGNSPESLSKTLEKSQRYIEFVVKGRGHLKDIQLYALIVYKKGNLKGHKAIIKRYTKGLDSQQLELLQTHIDNEKKRVKTFLWLDASLDYSNKLFLYKNKESEAASIIGHEKQTDKSYALNNLRSIALDMAFHKQNKYYLLSTINTRLANYYYEIEQNYQRALTFQKRVYKFKKYDLGFIGAFLRTLYLLEKFEFGLNACEFYLSKNRSSFLLRVHGNFLKENGVFANAYKSYQEALSLSKTDKEKAIIHNNILLLCHRCFEQHRRFASKKETLQIASDAYKASQKLNPFAEYLPSSVKLLTTLEKEWGG